MPTNKDILSHFIVDHDDFDITIEINVKSGDPELNNYLLMNLSFDVENKFEFFGTPSLHSDNSSKRIILVKKLF